MLGVAALLGVVASGRPGAARPARRGSEPSGSSAHAAYTAIAEEFGPGI
ncbi:MAG: hypothetical protein R2734_18295 [Nocardioides sp.]